MWLCRLTQSFRRTLRSCDACLRRFYAVSTYFSADLIVTESTRVYASWLNCLRSITQLCRIKNCLHSGYAAFNRRAHKILTTKLAITILRVCRYNDCFLRNHVIHLLNNDLLHFKCGVHGAVFLRVLEKIHTIWQAISDGCQIILCINLMDQEH
jgi:hypothetical protein